jgi:hypothetical protein
VNAATAPPVTAGAQPCGAKRVLLLVFGSLTVLVLGAQRRRRAIVAGQASSV